MAANRPAVRRARSSVASSSLPAVGHHLAPGEVDRRHDREVRAGGLDQLKSAAHRRRVELRRVDVQHGGLAQPGENLVHRLDGGRRPGPFAGRGKVRVEGEVWRMCAVDEEFGVVAAAQLGQCGDVTGGAVVRRVQHPERLGGRLGEGPLDDVGVETVCDAEAFVPPRFQPDGLGADLDQTGEHRLVGVARHQDRLTGTQRRQRDGDVPARRPLHQDEALARRPTRRRSAPRRRRSAPRGSAACRCRASCSGRASARCVAEPRVEGAAALVAGAVERRLVALDELLQRVEQRRRCRASKPIHPFGIGHADQVDDVDGVVVACSHRRAPIRRAPRPWRGATAPSRARAARVARTRPTSTAAWRTAPSRAPRRPDPSTAPRGS